MVASNDTVNLILNIVLRHVTPRAARRIVKDLLSVPGNKSFRDTIEKLHKELEQKYGQA
jgi:hypothetical protein